MGLHDLRCLRDAQKCARVGNMSARTKDKAYKVLTRIINNLRVPSTEQPKGLSITFSQDHFGELLVSDKTGHIHPSPEAYTTDEIIDWLYAELRIPLCGDDPEEKGEEE